MEKKIKSWTALKKVLEMEKYTKSWSVIKVCFMRDNLFFSSEELMYLKENCDELLSNTIAHVDGKILIKEAKHMIHYYKQVKKNLILFKF